MENPGDTWKINSFRCYSFRLNCTDVFENKTQQDGWPPPPSNFAKDTF